MANINTSVGVTRVVRTVDGLSLVQAATFAAVDTITNGDRLSTFRSKSDSPAVPLSDQAFGTAIAIFDTQSNITREDAKLLARSQGETTVVRGSKPTADSVRWHTPKIGSKLVMRIVPMNESKDDSGMSFEEFSLQSINMPRSEKYQIHETFQGEKWFLFGQRPMIWQMSGTVLNGKGEMAWADKLTDRYDKEFRASAAFDAQHSVFLTFEDDVVEAVLLDFTSMKQSQVQAAVSVSITIGVLRHTILGHEGEVSVDQYIDNVARRERANRLPHNGELTNPKPSADQLRANALAAQGNQTAANQTSEARLNEENVANAAAAVNFSDQEALTIEVNAAESAVQTEQSSPSPDPTKVAQAKRALAEKRRELHKSVAAGGDLELVVDAASASTFTATTASEVKRQAADVANSIIDLSRETGNDTDRLEAVRAYYTSDEIGGEFVAQRVINDTTYELEFEFPNGRSNNRQIRRQTVRVRTGTL